MFSPAADQSGSRIKVLPTIFFPVSLLLFPFPVSAVVYRKFCHKKIIVKFQAKKSNIKVKIVSFK